MESSLIVKILDLVPDLALTSLVLCLTFRHEKRMDLKDAAIAQTHRDCENKLENIADRAVEAIQENTATCIEVKENIKEMRSEFNLYRLSKA